MPAVMSAYPPALAEMVAFFETLNEAERRENLIDLAAAAKRHGPGEGESFDFSEVRKDAECSDVVGVFLRVDDGGRCHFAVSFGPHVQTLTRAMATVLCRGLEGATPREVRDVPEDFVPRIVGDHLVRLRSQTVYYVLSRMKEAARRLRERGGG